MIEEENIAWSGMVEDYNTVAKFKSDIVAKLNEYENVWSSNFDYKPFISYDHGDSQGDLVNEELDSLNNLNVQDEIQIADQYPFTLHAK